MKTFVWAGAAVAVMLGTSLAMAQMPPTAGDAAPPPPPMHGPMGPDGGGPRGMGMEPHGHPGFRGMMMRHAMRPESKAAHFRFRKGDAVVDIKCADDEPMKACVDAGLTLLDKVAGTAK